MPKKTVNQRLRRVDRRIDKIDRRLGFLQGRVFFTPHGMPQPIEVEIFSFVDQGITPTSVATGEQLSAHRFSVKLDRDWIESYTGQDGKWFIQRSLNENPVECEVENQEYQDTDTYATITLRVSEEINLEFDPVKP